MVKGRFLVLALLMIVSAGVVQAQQKTDLGAFVNEIMQLKLEGDTSQLAMWLPYEFFEASGLNEEGVTKESIEKELGFLKPYQVVVVQCSLDKEDGTSVYANETAVRQRAAIKLASGTEIKPLEEIPPMVSATVEAFKELISAEGDAGSVNMHVLVFPAQDAQGKAIVDTSKKDKLTLVLKAAQPFKETVFTWRTPFDAAKAAPPCSKCGEKVSSKWSYCPWCGTKL